MIVSFVLTLKSRNIIWILVTTESFLCVCYSCYNLYFSPLVLISLKESEVEHFKKRQVLSKHFKKTKLNLVKSICVESHSKKSKLNLEKLVKGSRDLNPSHRYFRPLIGERELQPQEGVVTGEASKTL